MKNNSHESQPGSSSLESVTARSKVFATTELLEMILVRLPELDALRSKRINMACCNTIIKSRTLQRKLFYECDLVNVDVDDLRNLDDLMHLETNPFIQLLHRRQFLARQNGEVYDNSLGNLDYPEASWKKMFLTQPALCTIETRKKIPGQIPNSDARLNIRFSEPDGIKMHHLQEMDLLRLVLPTRRFCIRCIGALASNRDKRIREHPVGMNVTRLHLYVEGYEMTPP